MIIDRLERVMKLNYELMANASLSTAFAQVTLPSNQKLTLDLLWGATFSDGGSHSSFPDVPGVNIARKHKRGSFVGPSARLWLAGALRPNFLAEVIRKRTFSILPMTNAGALIVCSEDPNDPIRFPRLLTCAPPPKTPAEAQRRWLGSLPTVTRDNNRQLHVVGALARPDWRPVMNIIL
jgi:hypothetical protein